MRPVDVIFLDIDGVLCPFGGTRDGFDPSSLAFAEGCLFPDSTMKALTDLLRRMQGIAIQSTNNDDAAATIRGNPVLVLSSTWRAQPQFIEDILASFSAYVHIRGRNDASVAQTWENHLASFFDIVDPNYHATRHEEIYSWVNAHAATSNTLAIGGREFTVRSWIALDDEDLVNVEGTVCEDAAKHAVRTKSAEGLAAPDVELGVRLARRQIEEFYGTNNAE